MNLTNAPNSLHKWVTVIHFPLLQFTRPLFPRNSRVRILILVTFASLAAWLVSFPNHVVAQQTSEISSIDGLTYVWIPPGSFVMGCSPGDEECDAAEKPPHRVTISKGFWIGQTETTVGAYKRFAEATGSHMPVAPAYNNDDNKPVVQMHWDGAQAYCGWMGGRLPTEAEWEYAACGGTTESRYGNLDEIAWHPGNSGGRTHDVGQKRANGFMLYDMLGNVMEWVSDWFDARYYQNSPLKDPKGPASGTHRVLRGGSWWGLGDLKLVRVSSRSYFPPAGWSSAVGFRCAK